MSDYNKQQLKNFILGMDKYNLRHIQKSVKGIYDIELMKETHKMLLDDKYHMDISNVLTRTLDVLNEKNITIVCLSFCNDDKVLYVEKNLLCKTIEYFKLLDTDTNINVDKHFIINIQMDEMITHDIMEIIVNFICKNEFPDHILYEEFLELLRATEFLLDITNYDAFDFSRKFMGNLLSYYYCNNETICYGIMGYMDEKTTEQYDTMTTLFELLLKNNCNKDCICDVIIDVILEIKNNKDLFFNSSLFKFILKHLEKHGFQLINDNNYFPLFKNIFNKGNSKSLMTKLLQNNPPELNDILYSLHTNHGEDVECSIIGCLEYVPRNITNMDLTIFTNNLIFALIRKFEVYDKIKCLHKGGEITMYIYLNVDIKCLLQKLFKIDNFATLLDELHEKLGEVINNNLLCVIDNVPETIFECNLQSYSNEFILLLILKFNRYEYFEMLKEPLDPVNYVINIDTYVITFVNKLLKENNENMESILKMLCKVLNKQLNDMLSSHIEHLPKSIYDMGIFEQGSKTHSLLVAKYGTLEEMKNINLNMKPSFTKNEIISTIQKYTNKDMLNVHNLNLILKFPGEIFCNEEGRIGTKFFVPNTVMQILNFIPEIKYWNRVGVATRLYSSNLINIQISTQNCSSINVNQQLLFPNGYGIYRFNKIKKLYIANDDGIIEVDKIVPTTISQGILILLENGVIENTHLFI
jgi:hypothetical protein